MVFALALAQDAVPDTGNFLALALVVFFGLLILFVGSITVRARNLRKDEAVVEQLRDDK